MSKRPADVESELSVKASENCGLTDFIEQVVSLKIVPARESHIWLKIKLKRKIKTCLDVGGLVKISGLEARVQMQQLAVEIEEIQTEIDVADISGGDKSSEVYLEILLRSACEL